MSIKFEYLNFHARNLELMRVRLKEYKADRKNRSGSNSNEDLFCDIGLVKDIPPTFSSENPESKGFMISLDRFLDGTQTPRRHRLEAIAALLISSKYITEKELTADLDEEFGLVDKHRVSLATAFYKKIDQSAFNGEYEIKSGGIRLKKDITLVIKPADCDCCLDIVENVVHKKRSLGEKSRIASRYHYTGWVSLLNARNGIAYLTRSIDEKKFVAKISVIRNSSSSNIELYTHQLDREDLLQREFSRT